MKRIILKSADKTKRFAQTILKELKNHSKKTAFVLALKGELGAGKTTLVQGVGRSFGIKGKIQSPTFVFVRSHLVDKRKVSWKRLVHIDAYRIENEKEIISLGLAQIFKDPENFVAVEWADKIKKFIPKNALWIELRHRGINHRHIIIKK